MTMGYDCGPVWDSSQLLTLIVGYANLDSGLC